MDDINLSPLLTLPQVAAYLQVSEQSVTNYVRQGRLRALRITMVSKPLFEIADVKRFLIGSIPAQRDMAAGAAAIPRSPNEESQRAELDRRCKKLAKEGYLVAVRESLKRYGAETLAGVHPSDFGRLRARLNYIVSPIQLKAKKPKPEAAEEWMRTGEAA